MFGKGGGPLNSWIKEFCELVFIQTLQAFVFALTMGFIISIMDAQIMDKTDSNSALAVVCIVALTSIFKIEDIARRIFGFGPTKADHGNAVASIGKSMIALKMGKNLLDNGKKVVGGFGAMWGGQKEKNKAIQRANKRYAALQKDNAGGGDSGDKGASVVSSEISQRKIDPIKRDEKISLTNDAQKARRLANQEKDEKKRKALIAEAKSKLDKANSIDDTLVEAKPVPSKSSGSSSSGGRIKDYNQKKNQIDEELQSKLGEISKKQRQGFKTMVSGVAETGAALVGFGAGTAMSVASTNDWGSALKDGISWAGAADAAAAGTVDFADGVVQFAENRVKNAGSMISEYKSNVDSAYKDYVKQIQNADKQVSDGTQKAMNNIKNDAEAAAKNVTMKNVKREARKAGFKKTVASHTVDGNMKMLRDTKERIDKMQTGKAVDTENQVFR